MNYSVLILLLLVIFLNNRRLRKITAIISVINRRKREKMSGKMEEAAKGYIGKDCIIYTVLGSECTVKGIIKDVSGGTVTVDSDGNTETVNLEFVVRIREWPKTKSGKRKTVFV